jgi:hypothetical protein
MVVDPKVLIFIPISKTRMRIDSSINRRENSWSSRGRVISQTPRSYVGQPGGAAGGQGLENLLVGWPGQPVEGDALFTDGWGGSKGDHESILGHPLPPY